MRRVAAAGLALGLALAGCGETEKSGSTGDELRAEDLAVTVERVDRRTRSPRNDITGLSVPSSGYRLVGVLAKVCSGWGAAIGPYDFSVESSAGDGRPKYSARNYSRRFEPVRDDCGRGWIVFEVPRDSNPTKVRFSFDDTGRPGAGGDDGVSARFEWKVE